MCCCMPTSRSLPYPTGPSPLRRRLRTETLCCHPLHRSCERPSTVQPAVLGVLTGAVLSATLVAGCASARLEGVNRPDLLPKGNTPVIDVAGFLTPGEESRMKMELKSLEEDTGIKLRVLAQNYPETPGLAVKDYWTVDENTVVFVADPSLGGNILNFNVGANVDLNVPRAFWTRLAGKFGTKFYWQDKGRETAIVNAVAAIDTCLREPVSRFQCSRIEEREMSGM